MPVLKECLLRIPQDFFGDRHFAPRPLHPVEPLQKLAEFLTGDQTHPFYFMVTKSTTQCSFPRAPNVLFLPKLFAECSLSPPCRSSSVPRGHCCPFLASVHQCASCPQPEFFTRCARGPPNLHLLSPIFSCFCAFFFSLSPKFVPNQSLFPPHRAPIALLL